MRAVLFEILPCPQGRLGIMPRPRGDDWLEEELASLQDVGVTDLVSALMPAEEAELGLAREAEACAQSGLHFHHHPIQDRGLPCEPAFSAWIDALVPILKQGGFIAVHCRAGIGRSSVIAAALLSRLGVAPEEALKRISLARGFSVPDTREQRDFILGLRRDL